MRLVAYLRVSSNGQLDAWGLDRQEHAIRQWAKTNRNRIVDWQSDEGVAGTVEAVDRPGLSAALAQLGNRADGILIADLDRFATFVRQVMGGVIEYEKKQAVRRMRLGREAKAAEGKHAVGTYPFGYEGTGEGRERDAAPREDEQAVIRRIVELRRAGESYRSIAATLDAEGRRPRKAAAWSAMSVRKVALRELPA